MKSKHGLVVMYFVALSAFVIAQSSVDGTWAAEGGDTFRATDLSGVQNVIKLVDGEALIPEGSVWQKN